MAYYPCSWPFVQGSVYLFGIWHSFGWFHLPLHDGLMEATLTSSRSPKQLKVTTLVLGLTLPDVVSSANTIWLIGTIIGNMVRLDRDPGSTPEWLGNLIVAIFVAVVVCLFLVYLLSYIHNSGAKRPFIFFSCALLGLSLVAVSTGVFPVYTEDISRAVNVVHVVETMGTSENQNISSYISLFSPTPGKLIEVMKNFNDEEFSCGRNKTLDLVTSTVRYGCWSSCDTEEGWSKSEIPVLNVESDYEAGIRKTQCSSIPRLPAVGHSLSTLNILVTSLLK